MADPRKVAFFEELYALGRTSDEEDTNDTRKVIRESTRPILSSSVSSGQSFAEVSCSPSFSRKPGFHRTSSAPVPSSTSTTLVKDTPLLPRHSYRLNITTPIPTEISFVEETPVAEVDRKPPERSVSSPTIGTNSTSFNGLDNETMLKKRKRKGTVINLKPEDRQIFKGQTFYYIPNDDIAPVRRIRITRAREYGAIWTTTWTTNVTHIIVDKAISYKDVTTYLKLETLPSNIVVVIEDYPIDCIQFRALLDPNQACYKVEGYQTAVEEQAPPTIVSQTKSRKWDCVPPKQIPPQSEGSTQKGQAEGITELWRKSSATGVVEAPEVPAVTERPAFNSCHGMWLLPKTNESVVLVESHQEASGVHSEYEIHTNQDTSQVVDALDEMIRDARTLDHLPLDEHEDEDDRPPSRNTCKDSDNSGDEERSSPPRKVSKYQRKNSYQGTFNQNNFICMKGGTDVTSSSSSNLNARTIAILQEMADYYTRIDDTWRPIAYRKAISTLRAQPTKITSFEEAFALPFVGERLALKIEEIAHTDRLRRLENAKMEPNDYILQLFINIYGVGFSQASKWLYQGFKTLEDLRAHAQLTDNQRLGLDHYDDFLTYIPREEVTAHGNIVKKTVATIDSEVKVIIGGSYRRGATNSGDIDCLLTKPGTSCSHDLLPFLETLVAQLTESGYLVAALAVPRSESGTKWHGCCVLPGMAKPIWRRIDFLLVPASELGAALIYFTGDDIFNRSIRLLSSKKGLRLNQRGLWKNIMREPGRVRMTQGTLVEGANEKKIFEKLGVPWRPPEQRICGKGHSAGLRYGH